MKIASKDVIQADSAPRVLGAIESVARGARTDKQIAESIGNLDARQGRYYRRAAEILGFIKRQTGNNSVLTQMGRKFARSNSNEKQTLLLNAFLSNALVTRIIPFLEGRNGASRKELESFLASVANLGSSSMIHRRVSSYMGWLRYFELAQFLGEKLVLKPLPEAVPFVTVVSDEEPILPKRFDLKEYEEQSQRSRNNKDSISYLVDQAARERAVSSHQKLVNMMAYKIRTSGAIPRSNRFIDLSARVNETNFLFEMKSTTQANLHHQIRLGLSQLYEYRYIQNVPSPCLVLVLEAKLPHSSEWLIDYLLDDRHILLVWDGNDKFSCPNRIANQLPFLS